MEMEFGYQVLLIHNMIDMKDSIKMIKNMVMEFIAGKMEPYTRDNS